MRGAAAGTLREGTPARGPGSHRHDALHVFALFGLALAQPLFAVLSESAHFFVASQAEPLDIVLLVLVVCLVPPAVVMAVAWLLGLLSRGLRAAFHTLVIAVLLATIAMPPLRRLPRLPEVGLLVAAGAIGAAGALAYRRLRGVRLFVSYLAVGLIVIPANFLLDADVSKLLFASTDPVRAAVRQGPAHASLPVVVVVFDELPLSSLLDARGGIDATIYPNFAGLAREAYWFRNATSVGDTTLIAVPAILTGRYPSLERLPTAEDYPQNLFTFLGRAYGLTVAEGGTSLCPKALCAGEMRRRGQRLASMLTDVALVYPFIVLPEGLTARLPQVTETWNDFAAAAAPPAPETPESEKDFTRLFVALLKTSDRRSTFAGFVRSITASPAPRLYFMHSLVPHFPWQYLPSGRTYGPDLRAQGLRDEIWDADEWAVGQGYQRHLLQAAFSDTLLGTVIARLKQVGLYDPALVVVLADHGSSYRPGEPRRRPTATNYQDLIRVPLLIKKPHQHEGVVSDRNVETIDVLPTVAEVIGAPLPWPVDGRSVFGDTERSDKRLVSLIAKNEFTYPAVADGLGDTISRKAALLGPGAGVERLFAAGPYKALVGRRLDDLRIEPAVGLQVSLDDAPRLAQLDTRADPLPAFLHGALRVDGAQTGPSAVALAINGRVRAVSPTSPSPGDAHTLTFAAMVPESSFRNGANTVDVLAVWGPEDEVRLAGPVPGAGAGRRSAR